MEAGREARPLYLSDSRLPRYCSKDSSKNKIPSLYCHIRLIPGCRNEDRALIAFVCAHQSEISHTIPSATTANASNKWKPRNWYPEQHANHGHPIASSSIPEEPLPGAAAQYVFKSKKHNDHADTALLPPPVQIHFHGLRDGCMGNDAPHHRAQEGVSKHLLSQTNQKFIS